MNDHTSNSSTAGFPGEHRDQDLARVFEADQVPGHGQDFWSNLQAEMSAPEAQPDTGPTDGGLAPLRPAGLPTDPTTPLPVVSGAEYEAPGSEPDTADEADETGLLNVTPITKPRRSVMPLLIAAASLAVVGLGIAALLSASNRSTTLDAADVSTEGQQSDDADQDTDQPTTTVPDAADTSVTQGEPVDAEPVAVPLPVDYFGPAVLTTIGTGDVVGFSPDGSAALIVDDAPGGGTGCEGAEVLTLYAQNLVTGQRRVVLPEGRHVETGGLDFLDLPSSDGTDGPFNVAGTDYCDGFRFSAWTATMAGDGTILDIADAEIDSLDDPFTLSGLPDAASFGAVALSPDRSLGLFVADGTAAVRPVGDENAEVESWELDSVNVTGRGEFDPTGQIVAVAGENQVHIWNFKTGDLASFPVDQAFGARFDRSGTLVGVHAFGFPRTANVVTFGDQPRPTVAEPQPDSPDFECSGAADLPALSVDQLVAQGVPSDAAETVIAIDDAAASCDWDRLATLMGEQFTASFGGGGVEIYRDAEAAGQDVLRTLRVVLRQPFGVTEEGATSIYSWPEVFTHEGGCDTFTDAHRQSLAELGYSEDDIASDCEFVGGYAGWRVGIETTGEWLFYVAGD